MSTIILAGGYGTRLYPLTKDTSKAMLTVGDRPILDHIYSKIVKLNGGNKRTVISTNKKFEFQFTEWLNKRSYQHIRIRADQSYDSANKPGAIRALADIVEEECVEDYLIIAGDNLFTDELEGFIRYYQLHNRKPLVGVYDVKDHVAAKEFSTISMDSENRIIEFKEKSDEPKATLIGTCIYLLPSQSLRSIDVYLRCGGNPDSPGYFIEWLSKREPVYGYMLRGKWWDIGTPKSYESVSSFYHPELFSFFESPAVLV